MLKTRPNEKAGLASRNILSIHLQKKTFYVVSVSAFILFIVNTAEYRQVIEMLTKYKERIRWSRKQ